MLAFVLALVFAIQTMVAPQLALAAAINVNPSSSGGIQGQVPVHKVGNLLFAEGLALINGSDISITAKSQNSNQLDNVLKGKIFKTEVTSQGGNTIVKGQSFFNGGSQLPSLEPNCKGESVDLNDGTKVVGPISDITQEAVTIASKSIPMSSVSAVHSGHVFNFQMKMTGPATNGAAKGDSSGMNFSPTCNKTTTVHAHNPNKRLIIYTAVALGIATAIACGVAIPLATHHPHHNPPPRFTVPTQPIITQQTIKTMALQPPVRGFPNIGYNVGVLKFLGSPARFTASTTGTGHTIVTVPPPPPPPPTNTATATIFLVRGGGN